MQQITTLKPKKGVELLVIVVDKDAYDFECNVWSDNSTTLEFHSKTFEMEYDSFEFGVDEENQLKEITLGFDIGSYTILGTVEYNKPIEFDCDEIILKGKRKEELDFGLYDEYETYFDYTKSVMTRFMTNERCFISLLEANNINLEQLDKENKKLIILQKL